MCARCLSLQALEYAESHKHKQYMGLFQVHCSALYLSWPLTEKDVWLGNQVVVAEVGHCAMDSLEENHYQQCTSTDPGYKICLAQYIHVLLSPIYFSRETNLSNCVLVRLRQR